MASVTLNSLQKTYPGGVTAVKGADVVIEDGEFIVLVGPSGCGKSTILRMIAGLEEVSGGTVEIGGRAVNDLEPGERDIAMVFQNYALYPHMSVRANMAYGLKNQGLPRADIDARIAEAAQTLQITDYLDRKPRQLSGGQRQRVAMGRAIVREPAVFLFDEPLSNLDAKLRTQLRAELKDLHARLRATFIFVTHDQVEAMSLADRIVIMSAGQIEQIGTPMELYDHPKSRFVAEFIGAPPMNIFETAGQIGQALARLGHLSPNASAAGIRPEALRLADGGPITARIRLIEALGAESIVHLQTDDARFVWRLGKADGLSEGQDVTLTADPTAITGFDAGGAALSRDANKPALTVVE